MDLESLREFVQAHADGVKLRMVDGTEYLVPHRDYVSFGPPTSETTGRRVTRTSFILYDIRENFRMRLLNALLVASVEPYGTNGSGKPGGRSRKKKQ